MDLHKYMARRPFKKRDESFNGDGFFKNLYPNIAIKPLNVSAEIIFFTTLRKANFI